jgi:general secretion pathway protein D
MAFGDSEASRLANKARKAQSRGDLSEAYLLYTQASTLDPTHHGYRAKADALGAKVASKAVSTFEEGSLSPELDPDAYFDSLTAADFAAAGKFRSPPELHPRQGRFDITFDGDNKSLFQQVATLFQLDCVFDSDYEAGRPTHLRLSEADYRDALHGLAAATNSFVVPVSDKVFLVAKDTPQKRTDLEQTMSVTVRIPQSLTSQELIEIAQTVRQVSGVEKLAWDNKTSSVVMRDRVSRVIPAQAIFRELLAYRPQVIVDLQLIEIRKSDIINYGINLPNVVNIFFTGQSSSSGNGTLPANTNNPFPFNSRSFTFINLATQSGGSVMQNVFHGLFPTSLSLWSISFAEANALVNFSNSVGRTLLTTNLRSVDSQAATFHFGEKYPILTGSYSVGATVGTQYVPPPSFTFEDLGVNLKITPHIHGMQSTTLDVESEFKILSGASVNGNPIISDRKLKSTVGLIDDEWAVIAGLEADTTSRSVSGTPGVSAVPIVSQIFQQYNKEKDKSEILILMRPRLISLPGNQSVTKEVRVGTETRPYTPL